MEQLAWAGHAAVVAATTLLLASGLARLRQAGKLNERPDRDRVLYRLDGAAWLLITGATALLISAFLTDAFGYAYVAGRSGRLMPWYYKVTALWAGQEGSLLFWLWLQSGYGLIVSRRAQAGRPLHRAAAGTLALVSAFFGLLVAFVANPFVLSLPAPVDGAGMNPILQSYWMTAHPVMLYLGFVGLSVPFAYAAAALLCDDDRWVHLTRRWAVMAWTFLSVGILFGARWAYEELGWGGYWGWDPVENASLMPWLVATAFIHSGIIQEKRGMLKRWNHVLVFAAYFLTLFGTFVTRSGILSSVHAFVESDISPWFIGFMGVISAGFLYGLVLRWPKLEDERSVASPISKESSFLANNVLFLATAFAIFWGTVFPLVAGALGVQVTVGAPYFERVTGPLFWLVIVLMGIGPLVSWRRAGKKQLQRDFTGPLVNGVLMAAWLWVAGLRETAVLFSLPASIFVLTTIILEFARGASARMRSRGEMPWTALWRMMNRNPGRYGGYVVHLGVLFIVVGIAASQSYQLERNAVLAVGEDATVGPYRVALASIDDAMHQEVPAVEATLIVSGERGRIGVLRPSKRFYPNADPSLGPTTEIAVYGTFGGDLYAVLAGWEPFGSLVGFKFFYNPLVWLIWAGGGLLVGGGAFSLWPRSKGAISDAERALATLAELEYDRQTGKVDEAEYRAIQAELLPRANAYLKDESAGALEVLGELREKSAEGRSLDGTGRALTLLLAAIIGLGVAGGPKAMAQATGDIPGMPSGAAVSSDTLVVRIDGNELAALNLVTVVNVGDQPVAEVRLPLAQGAINVEALPATLEYEGDPLASWLVDKEALAPGEERRYSLQYRIPVFRWPFVLSRPVDYPTGVLTLLAVADEMRVGGIDLAPAGVQEVGGQFLEAFESRWIPADTAWQALLTPRGIATSADLLPVLGEADSFPGEWAWRALTATPARRGVSGVVLAAVVVWIAATRLRKNAGGAPRSGAAVAQSADVQGRDMPLEDRLERAARGIARLDIAFREGTVPERTYAKRRRSLMQEAERLLEEAGAAGRQALADVEARFASEAGTDEA